MPKFRVPKKLTSNLITSKKNPRQQFTKHQTCKKNNAGKQLDSTTESEETYFQDNEDASISNPSLSENNAGTDVDNVVRIFTNH